MFVKHIIVEASIAHCKASKLSGIPIWVTTALDSSRNQPEFQKFLVEEAGVSAQISNQVAYFGADVSI
jgi:hypothetical protein